MATTLDDLPEFDVRTVSIIWVEDNDPLVNFEGCNAYEAIGMIRAALGPLERKFAIYEHAAETELCPVCGHDTTSEEDDDDA